MDLLEKRASAEIATPCYENQTPIEEMNKFKDWFLSNTTGEFRNRGAGRPTKRERREIDIFKDDDLHDDDTEEGEIHL